MTGPGPAGAARTFTAAQAGLFNAALQQLRGGSAAAALPLARQLVAQAPAVADAHQLLAMCLADTGDAERADASFRTAVRLAPGNPVPLVNFATWLRRVGRTAEALDGFRRAAALAPGHAPAWAQVGLMELDAGRPHEALEALERAVRAQPRALDAWMGLAAAHRATGNLERAEQALRKVLDAAPAHAPAWVNLGAVLRLQGRADEALACFTRARDAGFDSPELRDALAGTLVDAGRPGEALGEARQLVARHPGFAAGHATLAHILWEYGPVLAADEDPLHAFRAAADRQPDNRELQVALVAFLLQSRRADEALERIGALRRRDDHPVLAWQEADACQALGLAERAEGLYEALTAHYANHPGFRNARTRHLLAQGRWREAESHAAEAVRLDPRNQEGWAHLGVVWRLLDDPREHWLCDYERFVGYLEVAPPEGFASIHAFLDELEPVLARIHAAAREPVAQSLREGTQTPGRLFGRPEPLLVAAGQALKRTAERWVANLPTDPTHPFLSRRAGQLRFAGSWSVRLRSSGRHASHVHPEGWLSSAFYVSLPAAIGAGRDEGDRAGWLQFGQPLETLGIDLPPRRVVKPERGCLALFPSYFWHGTLPFTDQAPRTTIAFDMVPESPWDRLTPAPPDSTRIERHA